MPDNIDPSMAEVIERFRRASQEPVDWSEPSRGTWDSIAASLDLQPESSPPAVEPAARGVSRRTLFAGMGGLLGGVVLGIAGTQAFNALNEPDAEPVKRAVLTPLDQEDVRLGIAELRPLDDGYALVVDVPEGAQHSSGYVEVWLINVDLARMISVGVFPAGTASEFFVSDAVIDAGYLIVDLSNEEFDDEPHHSGDTIMRGELRV